MDGVVSFLAATSDGYTRVCYSFARSQHSVSTKRNLSLQTKFQHNGLQCATMTHSKSQAK